MWAVLWGVDREVVSTVRSRQKWRERRAGEGLVNGLVRDRSIEIQDMRRRP